MAEKNGKSAPDWWMESKAISVVVDNDSWVLPYAEMLVERRIRSGDNARLLREFDGVMEDGIAFFLGCTGLAPSEVIQRNQYTLVVHESDLPRGRGFSPMTWQILEGKAVIPVCLLEAHEEADAGPVYFRDEIRVEGHELVDELRIKLGAKTIELCERFLNAEIPPEGIPQSGLATSYARRRPENSKLDPDNTLAEQFNLLRVVDNERYPAFFDFAGHRYFLKISKTVE